MPERSRPRLRGGAAAKFHQRLGIFVGVLEEQIAFLEELLRTKRRPVEFLRLSTGILNALANAEWAGAGIPEEAQFSRFVEAYSGMSESWSQVSVPDMCLTVVVASEIFHGAGSRDRYELAFKGPGGKALKGWLKGIGLYDAPRCVDRALELLRKAFAVVAREDPRKREAWLFPADGVVAGVKRQLKRWRGKEAKAIISDQEALSHLAERFRLASLLYREVRCVVVHRVLPSVFPDRRRFWRNRNPYWVDVWAAFAGDWVTVEFPAEFLLQTVRNCGSRYASELRSRRLLPSDIWDAVYRPLEPGATEVLDMDRVG
jgi:hypothetical protein